MAGAHLDSKALVAKDLLGLLLPKFVLDEMQNPYDMAGRSALARDVGDVAILFCDIADFDSIVKKYEGSVVSLMDRIVRRFDDLCVLHGVQKIETVGKTYMAVGGLRQVEQALPPDLRVLNFTLRTLNLAKDMMMHIKEFEGLNLKIGIHVGRPVMGVIGYHKPQFSLIGDAVNTASRHCATGKKGRIMLSESAVESLEHLETATRGYNVEVVHTEMKGKGTVKVYHIYIPCSLFSQKLKHIVDASNLDADSEQLRQLNVLQKASMRKSASETDQEKPEEGGFYSIVLKNIKQSGTLSKALLHTRSSPKNMNRSAGVGGQIRSRARETNNQSSSIPGRTIEGRDLNPSRLGATVSCNNTNKMEPFVIDASVFDAADDEKIEDEVTLQ